MPVNDNRIDAVAANMMLGVLATDARKTSDELTKLKNADNVHDIAYLQGCLGEAVTWITKARDHTGEMIVMAAEVRRTGGDT